MAGHSFVQLSFGNVEFLLSKNKVEHSSEAIFMLHGATADKTSWTRFSKYLGSKLPLVIPDFPGHGNSTADININYSINAQQSASRSCFLRLESSEFI